MKFDARVVGVPNHLVNARKYLSRADFVLEQAKLKAAEDALLGALPEQGQAIEELFHRRLECISHFRCERFNFLGPLQQFAAFLDNTTPEEVVRHGTWTGSVQVMRMGQADSMTVPLDFETPLDAQVQGRAHPYMVCSGPRVKREIDALDEYVAVKETMGRRQFDAFVTLSRMDMERFERQEGVGRRFWAKWGVMALRGLVERSLEARVPLIVDPQFGEVPATT